jgi:hypothetical protein
MLALPPLEIVGMLIVYESLCISAKAGTEMTNESIIIAVKNALFMLILQKRFA